MRAGPGFRGGAAQGGGGSNPGIFTLSVRTNLIYLVNLSLTAEESRCWAQLRSQSCGSAAAQTRGISTLRALKG